MSASESNLSLTTAGDGWFKTTHWSVVLDAGRGDSPQASAALAKLCQTYWHPVYFFVRRLGHGPEDAKDLTQEFFLRLVEKDYLKALDRETGKFRSFLLVVLKRFLANEWDRAKRQKRGGDRQVLSLDDENGEARYLAELVEDRTPETVFEQRWAVTLLEQVIHHLEMEFVASGKAELFEELKIFLTGEKSDRSYDELARQLAMSEGTLRVTIHRLRQRYRELLRLEIGHTVSCPTEIDGEIRHLFACLSA